MTSDALVVVILSMSGICILKRWFSVSANGAAIRIMTDDGSRNSPACVTDAFRPKPSAGGSCTSCGRSRIVPNMLKPIRNAVMFVVHIGCVRIVRMSMRGSCAASSNRF